LGKDINNMDDLLIAAGPLGFVSFCRYLATAQDRMLLIAFPADSDQLQRSVPWASPSTKTGVRDSHSGKSQAGMHFYQA
jgi:hypothetical protein